jgi:hypothetical protein
MNKNTTYGKIVPPRFQRFSKADAGKQVRPTGVYYPNNMPASFDPVFMYNPSRDNDIFQHDPMTLQRTFMVSPCKEDDVGSQMLAHRSGKHGIYAQPYTAVPVNPLSRLGISVHDRLGAFGLADFTQKPFLQTSNY